jgi:hypothetical protein
MIGYTGRTWDMCSSTEGVLSYGDSRTGNPYINDAVRKRCCMTHRTVTQQATLQKLPWTACSWRELLSLAETRLSCDFTPT